jgi:RNA polymerase sigma-70 factor, ECF subfamily
VFIGAERVTRILAAMTRHYGDGFGLEPIVVNGTAGLLLHTGRGLGVMALTVDRGRISAIDIVRNPEKLRTLPVAT